MSGSSLDGLDIAYCEFVNDEVWKYDIIIAETIPYPESWLSSLQEAPNIRADKLIELDINFGLYIGKKTHDFISKHGLSPDIVSSHGHTVFHNPEKGYTLQIGNGQAIAQSCGIKTINDFRTGDILLGGQGAPLVPIGDRLLFSEYDYCLNIGGIANVSYEKDGKRIASDICPANQLLNYLSRQLGSPFDTNGNYAQLGKLNLELFKNLNNHNYYSLDIPKSISNQLVVSEFIPILDNSDTSVQDKLYTVCKHIAFQLHKSLENRPDQIIVITGGGAHNTFLTTAIKLETGLNVVLPSKRVVDFKEAMIFAFLGVLRSSSEVNCLASSTGADRDSSVGVIHYPL